MIEIHVYLIKLPRSWKQRLAQRHLVKYAAHAPNIHSCRIGLRREQQLRWAIPECDHLGRSDIITTESKYCSSVLEYCMGTPIVEHC